MLLSLSFVLFVMKEVSAGVPNPIAAPSMAPSSVGVIYRSGYIPIETTSSLQSNLPYFVELIGINKCLPAAPGETGFNSWKVVWAQTQASQMVTFIQEYSDNFCEYKTGAPASGVLLEYVQYCSTPTTNSYSYSYRPCSTVSAGAQYHISAAVASDISQYNWDGVYSANDLQGAVILKIHHNHRRTTVPYVDQGCFNMDTTSPSALVFTFQNDQYNNYLRTSPVDVQIWAGIEVPTAIDGIYGGCLNGNGNDHCAYASFYSSNYLYTNCVNYPTTFGGEPQPFIRSLYGYGCALYLDFCNNWLPTTYSEQD